MGRRAVQGAHAFVSAALAASRVGTWESDLEREVAVCDAGTAALHGLDAAEAGGGLPLAVYAEAIHPEDRRLLGGQLARVREHGGLFVVEYRTRPAPGDTRWILARGRYERDARTGAMTGRGIVIDITESKLDGHDKDHPLVLTSEAAERTIPEERAAKHAIALRKAVDLIGDPVVPELRQAVDAVLWAVGRALARRERR